MEWEVVLGLEVHAQLATQTKIFSGSKTAYGASPNSQASMIDLAFPGTLPVLNRGAVEMALKFGIATHAEINRVSVFDRKQYFYPDLPKGYQISQLYTPIIGRGYLDIECEDGIKKRIGITRAHLEEDAGKSLHDVIPGMSGIDLNRAGTPLLEIVSEPDLRSAEEAVAYLKTIHALVTYLGICDGNMQEGSFRCDVNVSLRPVGTTAFGTRSEIKNVNSFRYVDKAIHYEIERHKEILENGGTIVQETRLYDATTNTTRSMRSKEEANDYRYFPDPDLLPVLVSDAMLAEAQSSMPELPWEKQTRFQHDYGLSAYDAHVLIGSRALADYFESAAKAAHPAPAKLVANWVTCELAAALNKNNVSIETSPIEAERLAGLVQRIHDDTVSGKMAKTVFETMWQSKETADQIIERAGLKQVTDDALSAMINKILQDNPEQLAAYRAGKDKLFAFFVGQVMKATSGQANPKQLNELLIAQLTNFVK